MKKIDDYRELFGATKDTDLNELKSIYRTAMKNWHPDKFNDDEVLKEQAEHRSKLYIEAYHFLVSIAPETIEQTKETYASTITTCGIQDFKYSKQILTVEFTDGSSYEYFAVPKLIFTRLVNSDSQPRYARRHIFTSFLYRNVRSANAV
jgi:hypothetical protein